MRIGIVVSSCSLLVVGVALATAADFVRLDTDLGSTPDADAAVRVARALVDDPTVPDEPKAEARNVIASSGQAQRRAIERVRQYVGLMAAAQHAAALGDSAKVRGMATDAKRSPFYADPGDKESSNWVAKGFERLRKLRPPKLDMPDASMNVPTLPYFLVYVVWALLGAAVLGLAYLAIRHFAWKRGLTRKARALMEDDEPERTLDEWLELAKKLSAEGKHREAVRCLYLACLLRFDEHGVARFDRSQTNWEHLYRIRESPKLPIGFDFESPTKRFDTVWYGQRTRGLPDVEQFTDWYRKVTDSLAGAKT